MARKLAVIAGSGPLPAQVVAEARAAGREVFVLAIENETEAATLEGVDHAWVKLGAVARTMQLLRETGAEDVCLIGPVRKPSLSSLGLDWRAVRMLTRLGGLGAGDDKLFRLIVAELESEGFRVIGADQVSGGLLAPAGLLGAHEPDEAARADIRHGIRVCRRLGELDVGQAVVVQQGMVLGVEAIEGTDALLARVGPLRREGPGGVLVKLKKPGQERRADLPTIGAATIGGAVAAGLRGIAIEAGECLIVDRDEVARAADESGLFVLGIDASM